MVRIRHIKMCTPKEHAERNVFTMRKLADCKINHLFTGRLLAGRKLGTHSKKWREKKTATRHGQWEKCNWFHLIVKRESLYVHTVVKMWFKHPVKCHMDTLQFWKLHWYTRRQRDKKKVQPKIYGWTMSQCLWPILTTIITETVILLDNSFFYLSSVRS